MKRTVVVLLLVLVALGSATIFAIDDSRSVPPLAAKPVCRTVSSSGGCLVWMYPGGTVSPQRLETIRKNIYYKAPAFSPRGPLISLRGLPH